MRKITWDAFEGAGKPAVPVLNVIPRPHDKVTTQHVRVVREKSTKYYPQTSAGEAALLGSPAEDTVLGAFI